MQILRLTPLNKTFPAGLRAIAQPPASIYVKGATELLQGSSLAVVGSRLASPYGKQATKQLITEVALAGVTVVSGLAFGIDSLAHQAALDSGGKTVAVLPCGIETVYPASHQRLAEQIIRQGGALVSEYPGKMRPQKQHFIARNRLIAGLATATLIIEAAHNSGSLHTAQFALEEGKEVLAVPGSIFSNTSVGTHNLIKDGAKLVQDSQDILELFGPSARNPVEATILGLLKQGVKTEGELQKLTGLTTQQLSHHLTLLEITGLATKQAGGWHPKT